MTTTLRRFPQGVVAEGSEVGGVSGNDWKVAQLMTAIGNSPKRQRWAAGVATSQRWRNAANVSLGANDNRAVLFQWVGHRGVWVRSVSLFNFYWHVSMEPLTFSLYKQTTWADPLTASGVTEIAESITIPTPESGATTTLERIELQINKPWVQSDDQIILRVSAGAGGLTAGRCSFTPVLRYMALHVA